MKTIANAAACLLMAVTLNGCMEALEAAGAIAEAVSEDDAYAEPEDSCTPTPASCRKTRPETAALHVRVSTPLPTTVTIYRGDFEGGRRVWSGPPSGASFRVELPLGTYSATATYAHGKKTVIAVDGDDLEYDFSETCEDTCYEALDGTVDLELEN